MLARSRSILLLLLVVAMSVGLLQRPLQAQEGTDKTLRELDLVLLIDESGSAWAKTDPEFEKPPNPEGTPPYRIQAAQLLIQLLAAEPAALSHRVSVFMFGTGVKQVWPEPKNAKGQRALDGTPDFAMEPIAGNVDAITKRIKEEHYRLGSLLYTDALQAFQNARTVLDQHHTDGQRRPVVLMITDGKPETEQANIIKGENTPEGLQYQAYLESIKSYIGEFRTVKDDQGGCGGEDANTPPIFLVAVDLEALTALQGTRYVPPEFDSFWAEPLGNHFRRVKNFPVLNGEITQLFAQLLCAVGGQPTAPEEPPDGATFSISDDYQGIIFTVVRTNAQTTSQITPPGGLPITFAAATNLPGVRVSQTEATQVWSFNQDIYGGQWAGDWKVEVTSGTGTVQFAFIPIEKLMSYDIDLQSPAPNTIHPAGKALDIVSQLRDKQNQVYPKQVQVFTLKTQRVSTTGAVTNAEQPLQIDQQDPTRYRTQIQSPLPGQLTLNLQAELENSKVVNLKPARTIEVRPLPFITDFTPKTSTQLFAQEPFSVTVSARWMSKKDSDILYPVDPVAGARTTITATLIKQPEGTVAATQVLSYRSTASGITHQGQLPGPDRSGNYDLIITSRYSSTSQIYFDTTTRSLSFLEANEVQPTLTAPPQPSATIGTGPTPTPPDPVPDNTSGLLVPGVIVALLGGAAAWWFSTQGGPRLNGSYLSFDNGSTPLRGHKHTVPLLDSSGIKQANVEFRRINGPNGLQGQALIKQINPGQTLHIDGYEYTVGEVVELNSGSRLTIGDRTITYSE